MGRRRGAAPLFPYTTLFRSSAGPRSRPGPPPPPGRTPTARQRSEEHTSELQSLMHLVCRLLLEKKKTNNYRRIELDRTPILFKLLRSNQPQLQQRTYASAMK